jgi:hypothetical protein
MKIKDIPDNLVEKILGFGSSKPIDSVPAHQQIGPP